MNNLVEKDSRPNVQALVLGFYHDMVFSTDPLEKRYEKSKNRVALVEIGAASLEGIGNFIISRYRSLPRINKIPSDSFDRMFIRAEIWLITEIQQRHHLQHLPYEDSDIPLRDQSVRVWRDYCLRNIPKY